MYSTHFSCKYIYKFQSRTLFWFLVSNSARNFNEWDRILKTIFKIALTHFSLKSKKKRQTLLVLQFGGNEGFLYRIFDWGMGYRKKYHNPFHSFKNTRWKLKVLVSDSIDFHFVMFFQCKSLCLICFTRGYHQRWLTTRVSPKTY